MAAAKHSLADGEAVARPLKKTKVDVGGETPVKQSKKERKKEKKEKSKSKELQVQEEEEKKDGETEENGAEDLEAQRRAKKESKREKKKKLRDACENDDGENGAMGEDETQGKKQKKEKREKKQEKGQDERQKMTHEGVNTKEKKEEKKEEKTKKKTKKTKRKHDGESNDEAKPAREYVQTMSLSIVPQPEIDAFISSHQITLTDPRGTDATSCRPVMAFEHLPATNLLEKRPSPFADYTAPTPIQAASWPYTLAGRDVVGVAETGSGKTMAFALPCVEAVSDQLRNSPASRSATHAVVVSPTRELAMQTHVQLAGLARRVGLGCTCIYGGASKDEQRAALARPHGADIIVATPGRLRDFMADATINLSAARFVVLDEADRMLDTGFEDDIRAILGACMPLHQRQTLMFTATWPQSVQTLAVSFMVDPVRIAVGGAAVAGMADGGSGAVELQANARITQSVEVMEPHAKESRLLQIVRQRQQGKQSNDRILVFCLYKKEATRIEAMLSRRGVRVVGIHGDLRQEKRTRSLEAFKSGETPVLVATDVAARGLDIPEVKLVVNVTFPLTIEDYVHRIGRTGRAGNTGEAITFFTIQDKGLSGSLVNILKGANQPVPDELLKFGTTVKKKQHDMYGSFFKDVDMNQKATKITFD